VVASLVAHVAAALDDSGDRLFVDTALARLLARGTGSTAQRTLFTRSSDLTSVVLAAADLTLA
jgi:carboxylate-amine ligase